MSRRGCLIPDDKFFSDFKKQCQTDDNWRNKYNKNGMEVLVETPPLTASGKQNPIKIHKIKCKMAIKDVSAATMYDVLHDSRYRKTWDDNMEESYDIARLSDNSDVGYYSWRCPPPVKNRDVVTLRSWMVGCDEYLIVNFSVKHPEVPPKKDLVRAVSIMTGYLIKSTGPNSCHFTYLSQADPRGSLPTWLVNKAYQVMAPKVMKCLYKAGLNYPAWKERNSPDYKPWLFSDQVTLPKMDLAELSIQRADSLENVDESSALEAQENEDSS